MSIKTPRSSSAEARTLVIVRHAHRDKPLGWILDNGLSDKGEKQARRVAKHFVRRFGEAAKPVILSSPKRRCVQTVEPLGQAVGVAVKRHEDLDEGELLEARARKFLDWWKAEGPALTVACSHGDWIPVFMDFLTGRELDLDKGGWIEINQADGETRVVEVHQALKDPAL
jgi:broad specificity phosphatase PhoE